MANVKISALPSTSAATFNDWLIKNDSGETTTSKVQLKNVLGMTSLNGNNAIQSSSWLTNLGTTASTQSAIAIGNGAEATSPYSIAIGYEAFNSNRDGGRDYYICIGYQTRAVQGATAIGKNAGAFGADATSIGQNAQTFGNGGFALGNSSFNAGTNGVAIGTQAEDFSNNGGVAIGFDTRVNHDYAVALGSGVTTIYSSTTHVTNIHTFKTETFDVIAAGNVGGNINVDCSLGTIFTFALTANTTPNFINIKEGQRFIFIVENTGTFTVPTATVGGVSSTVYAEGGSLNPTNNGFTKYMAVYANSILWINEELGYTPV